MRFATLLQVHVTQCWDSELFTPMQRALLLQHFADHRLDENSFPPQCFIPGSVSKHIVMNHWEDLPPLDPGGQGDEPAQKEAVTKRYFASRRILTLLFCVSYVRRKEPILSHYTEADCSYRALLFTCERSLAMSLFDRQQRQFITHLESAIYMRTSMASRPLDTGPTGTAIALSRVTAGCDPNGDSLLQKSVSPEEGRDSWTLYWDARKVGP